MPKCDVVSLQSPSSSLIISSPNGGFFLDPILSPSLLQTVYPLLTTSVSNSRASSNKGIKVIIKGTSTSTGCLFSSVSLKVGNVGRNNHKTASSLPGRGAAINNSSKHLWAGAVAAMVARTIVAPLERLKLEYIVRGEQKNIVELVRTIAVTQGLRGFWKGNFLNILRTAPFKAINFCAYDTYRKQLCKLHFMEGTSNAERFIAGAAAGITATVLCLPLDTIRTRIVARGGEQLGGVIGAFHYMIKTEGIFSLYRGLLPSIMSIAPSSAVFYGVYDILKTAYLRSPEGKKRALNLKQQGQELTALGQLELGPLRTLLHGAISGACAEVATYPFEVVRRQMQMQVKLTKLSTFGTFVKIVEQGGIPALYAGLLPSLLQVLPSAAISYFVYECMKIVLKAE